MMTSAFRLRPQKYVAIALVAIRVLYGGTTNYKSLSPRLFVYHSQEVFQDWIITFIL